MLSFAGATITPVRFLGSKLHSIRCVAARDPAAGGSAWTNLIEASTRLGALNQQPPLARVARQRRRTLELRTRFFEAS